MRARVSLATLLVALSASANARADDGFLFHPEGPGRWRVRVGAGGEFDLLPRALVESELRVVPRVAVHARLGMPWGFSADLTLRAVVLDNMAAAGLAWSRAFGPFSVQVQARFGAAFGWVFLDGFDLAFRSWILSPGVSFGLRVGPHRITLAVDGHVVLGQSVDVGEATVSRARDRADALGITLISETTAGRRGRIYLGVTALIARPDWQLWLAFSDSNQPSLYPRFMVGYVF